MKVATTGFATVGQAAGARASKGAGASIYSKILECRECESQHSSRARAGWLKERVGSVCGAARTQICRSGAASGLAV